MKTKIQEIITSIITAEDNQTYLTRFWLLRGLGFIYFCVFFPLIFQFKALLGENGLLPLSLYLEKLSNTYGPDFIWWKRPTLFWLNQSDTFAMVLISLGIFLSLVVVFGYANSIIMGLLWLLQLSFTHIGQTFWSFGWEANLLELGFLAIFLCPFLNPRPFLNKLPPSTILFFFYRWALFRLMLGSGLIKIRGDECWKKLSCLQYHFETQPIPGPLSSYFHFLPEFFLKSGVVINHIVELIIPWFLFFPSPFRHFAGIIFLLFQAGIMISGNYAWINYLTIIMIIPCFNDDFLKKLTPQFILQKISNQKEKSPLGLKRKVILTALTTFLLIFSYKPLKNLIGPQQIMNTSYDQFYFVNSYGLFGGVTKKRYEIVLKGTLDKVITPQTKWIEYSIPCKPGDIQRTPCILSPYHYRITWQIWFAAMGNYQYNPWLVHWVFKILHGNDTALSLLENNPFPKSPPTFIKADLYQYEFTNPYKGSKVFNWYKRKWIKVYLPPLHKNHSELINFIQRKKWPIHP